ncbi:hypothetical protein [Aliarcobacter butzleri]|uniref:hypothetical protein n=1 Tax=Aliarcobacter butzleri TaxID=28197 RepID=UPI002B250B50|nr:hypothetical protein [Aliarcobacter butzleri]
MPTSINQGNNSRAAGRDYVENQNIDKAIFIISNNPNKKTFINYLFSEYFELRNIPCKIFNLKLFELLRYVFSFFTILVLAFGLFIYFTNFILVDLNRKIDFLIYTISSLCLPILFAITVHYILEKAFIKDKGTIKLKLKPSSKGRFYFTIDFAFFIFLFYNFI